MSESMVVIRQYLNEMEALIARSVLEANDVPAVVLRDDAGGMLPALHVLFPVRLAVRTQDASEALHILDSPFERAPGDEDDMHDLDIPGAV